MRTSRILQVSAYYPPHLGGQENAVHDLAIQLASIGQEVEVVTSSLGASKGTTVEHGVRVTRLRSSEFGHTAIIWGLPYWLLRHARRQTVVHLHIGQFFTPEMVWLASKILHFKYVIQLHIDPVPSGPMGRLIPLYKRLFLSREIRDAEAVIVLNDEHRHIIHRDYRRDDKVVVMSNGINDNFFEVARDPVNSTATKLLFVGRLSPQKNLTVLLEAISMVKEDVTLDVIGDGECKSELERFIFDKELKNVTLHGRLSRDEIKGFYSKCSVLILPSLYEAQPMVLLEATACRIPVIATKVIGLEEAANGSAILVEPTAKGIADGIAEFAAMPSSDVNQLVDAAFRKAKMLEWKTLIRSYVRLYDAVAEEPHSRKS